MNTFSAHSKIALLAVVVLLAGCGRDAELPGPAAVVEHFDIREREPAFDGRSFGDSGSYERIRARAHLRIDPGHPANQGIADLDRATTGDDGWVPYAADVEIWRPRDPARARRVLLVDVPNRGIKLLGSLANDAAGMMGSGGTTWGNGFLMREGYTVVWVGWQADVAGPDLLAAALPPVLGEDGPVTGQVQQRIVFDDDAATGVLPLAWPAAALEQSDAQLTVRAHNRAPPRPLPAAAWRFRDARTVEIERPQYIDAGAIHELIYTARDPLVTGLGLAATRDVVSFLRFEAEDLAGNPNPLRDLVGAACEYGAGNQRCDDTAGQPFDLALAVGASQSGRYLRDWLWQGFQVDGQGRQLFEGMLPLIAGSRTTFTNVRWGEPGRFSRQHEDHRVYGDQFPFGYGTRTDPLTGATDGLLRRCRQTDSCPLIMHLDTSAEFWQAGASLVAHDGIDRDLMPPGNVRLYLASSISHFPAPFTPPQCRFSGNPAPFAPLLRALLPAMVDWVAGRAEPPPSRWPTQAAGTLAPPLPREDPGFPDLAALGLQYTGAVNSVRPMDYHRLPHQPLGDGAWQVLVPVTDADGHDLAGVRLPDIAEPLGTHLGWNPRREGFAEGELCFIYGAFLPFAIEDAARVAGDPRPALLARYPDVNAYVQRVRAVAEQLADERLLLAEDVARYADSARERFNALTAP